MFKVFVGTPLSVIRAASDQFGPSLAYDNVLVVGEQFAESRDLKDRQIVRVAVGRRAWFPRWELKRIHIDRGKHVALLDLTSVALSDAGIARMKGLEAGAPVHLIIEAVELGDKGVFESDTVTGADEGLYGAVILNQSRWEEQLGIARGDLVKIKRYETVRDRWRPRKTLVRAARFQNRDTPGDRIRMILADRNRLGIRDEYWVPLKLERANFLDAVWFLWNHPEAATRYGFQSSIWISVISLFAGAALGWLATMPFGQSVAAAADTTSHAVAAESN